MDAKERKTSVAPLDEKLYALKGKELIFYQRATGIEDEEELNKVTIKDIYKKELKAPFIDPNKSDLDNQKSITKWVNDILDIQFINLHKLADLSIKENFSNPKEIIDGVLDVSSWQLLTPYIVRYIKMNFPKDININNFPEITNLLYKEPQSILVKMEEFNTFDSNFVRQGDWRII